MNYNQILGKISEETKNKVSKEYHEIYKKNPTKEDFNGANNKINTLLHDKNIKIDDTIRKKLKDTQSKLVEALSKKDLKAAKEVLKDIKNIPEISKDVNAQDILKYVDKRDLAYLALDKFLDKQITQRIYDTLHVDSLKAVPAAIGDKRSQIVTIIKTYKHIKNTNPELANTLVKELSTNINKQLDQEVDYAKNKYLLIAQQQSGKQIDNLYTKATQYLDIANKTSKTYLDKAVALEDKLNAAISGLDNTKIGGFAKVVNMNLQLSKIDYVSKQVERVNKYLVKYNEIAKKALDRAKTWATEQVTKLATKALGAIGKQIGKIAKSALGKFKI